MMNVEVWGQRIPRRGKIFVATVTPVVKMDTVESVPGGHGNVGRTISKFKEKGESEDRRTDN